MARKYYKDAAKTAVIIGSQEQISGNYRSAHDLLFSMYQVMESIFHPLKGTFYLKYKKNLVGITTK